MANMDTWQQFWYYLANNGSYVLSQFARHFLISIYGVLIAAVIGIPIGLAIARHRTLSSTVIGIANVIQTIPSLAMLIDHHAWSRAGCEYRHRDCLTLLAAADHQEHLHRHAKCRQELDGCG
jgi:ABC-type tungstate transport system substrate-binding protein